MRRILNTSRVKEQVSVMIIWSVYLYIFVGSETAIFVPRGKRSDWIFINVFFFFLLIYRKRKFCAEPMRERLTFHFELRTRSVNFRFFFLFFFSFFLFFQIKARSRLVTGLMVSGAIKGKEYCSLQHLSVVANKKGAFELPSTTDSQLT